MADLPAKKGQRAPFALYLFSRGLGPADVFKALDCSKEHVRRICLPYDDDQWRAPSDKLKQKIASWTQGEIKLTDWEAPRRREAACYPRKWSDTKVGTGLGCSRAAEP